MTSNIKTLAIVTPGYYEQCVGGSEYQSYLLAEAAKNAGMDVHHVYISLESIKSVPNHLDISLYPVRSPGYRKYIRGLGNTAVCCVPRGYRILKEIQPDCVYCRSGVVQAGLAAYYAKKYGCKSVWHVASSADVTPRSFLSLLRRPLDLIERKAIEYAIRHSTHVVSQAQFQDDLLRRHYGRASEVILQMLPEPREPLVKNGQFTVVWVANIKPLKQPEMFVRLARELLRARENVRFVMIGRPAGGKYQEELDAEIGALSNIEYLGEQPIERVNAILAESHVFVNTSAYEGLPNTFVQAWMREVPVVCMLLDPDEILRAQEIGYMSGSFEQMVRDVRKLIENPALRDEMGRRAREYAMENHSLEKNMGRLLDLIRS